MKLVFVDIANRAYDADTPFHEPLGGTQSAAVYLATELAALGIDVSFVNHVRAPRSSRGINFLPADEYDVAALDRFDIVVSLSYPFGAMARHALGPGKPLILWNHLATDQPQMRPLARPEERDAWTAFAMTSNWQAAEYERVFAIPPNRMAVRRNAIAPAFLDQPVAEPWFKRGEPPTLAYTSTPFRGLNLLLIAFPTIRKAIPEARLRVFSGMSLYHGDAAADRYTSLYELARALPGVSYEGVLAQPALAREMHDVAALTYPSLYPETSCIAALEAMASGALVLATEFGALPETTAGFARLLKIEGDVFDATNAYAAMVIAALREAEAHPDALAAHLAEQTRRIRADYTWTARAREWRDWLTTFA
ncbi:MAG TPA: glycosyltransferase family 4 protein [Alphaproteobacteria bacterium]|jgi:glycosyltransferase involved in cell wall biosynthesis|nr:glycosyltransferase family 4 protein [Alphaproteobacteria bacterium]